MDYEGTQVPPVVARTSVRRGAARKTCAAGARGKIVAFFTDEACFTNPTDVRMKLMRASPTKLMPKTNVYTKLRITAEGADATAHETLYSNINMTRCFQLLL